MTARAVTWPLVPLLMAATLLLTAADPGRYEASLSGVLVNTSYVLAVLAPYVVGVLLTVRVPRHGAG
jgi:hypothetical protein